MEDNPRMSIDVALFSAVDDVSAAAAERRPGGPLGWPVQVGVRKLGVFRREPIVEAAGPAFDGFAARGYDGAVNMGTLEELLTGTPYDSLATDPRWGGSLADDDAPEGCGALTLTQTLRDALAETDDRTLEAIVRTWASTEELRPPDDGSPTQEDLDDHLTFLKALRNLAVRAKDNGHQLYWYFML